MLKGKVHEEKIKNEKWKNERNVCLFFFQKHYQREMLGFYNQQYR